MLPDDHLYSPDSNDLSCTVCNLPVSNRVHLPTHIENSSTLVSARCAEFQIAKENMHVAMQHLTRLTVREEHPTAKFVGFNVSEQYDSGHTFTTVNVEGIYALDGTALATDTEDDLDSLVEWEYVLLVDCIDAEPNDGVVYYVDIDTWDSATTLDLDQWEVTPTPVGTQV